LIDLCLNIDLIKSFRYLFI